MRTGCRALDRLRHGLAAHRRLDNVLHVADIDAKAFACRGRCGSRHTLAGDLVGEDVRRFANRAENRGDLLDDALISPSFEPKTFTATGSCTPVESISIRAAIGWVKLLPQPASARLCSSPRPGRSSSSS
jgi:hypothetical protein